MNNKFISTLVLAAATVSTLSAAAPASAAASSNLFDGPAATSIQGIDVSPYQQYVQAEGLAINNSAQFLLNPNALKLKYDHNVSTYFINENAGYQNQLAFMSSGTTTTQGLLFNDISYTGTSNGLQLGAGVSVGNIKGGSQLDFFLRGNGLNRGADAS